MYPLFSLDSTFVPFILSLGLEHYWKSMDWTVDSVEQDQTPWICRLIMVCTVKKTLAIIASKLTDKGLTFLCVRGKTFFHQALSLRVQTWKLSISYSKHSHVSNLTEILFTHSSFHADRWDRQKNKDRNERVYNTWILKKSLTEMHQFFFLSNWRSLHNEPFQLPVSVLSVLVIPRLQCWSYILI